MSVLKVGLGERSYPIIIETGFLENVGTDLENRQIAKRYAIIADDRVAELYSDKLMTSLSSANLQFELLTFPHGEENKNLTTFEILSRKMAELHFDRKDGIIALGGGVTGDLAGFVAATYMRGISFVQIPTTLLAQVDSSVGGKTGVDIPEGKNLVGSFYQPKAVYIDPKVLNTLDKEELLGGLAEVIKYGVIRDAEFFNYLREKRENILELNTDELEKTIYNCCRIKADVVSEDEREGDVRRILNYGHTIGHAVEAASDFGIIHGLAVSMGMVAAAKLAEAKGLLSTEDMAKVVSILEEYKMPTTIPAALDRQEIKNYLLTDKKTVAGKVHYVLPTKIGDTVITSEIDDTMVDQVLV